MNLIAYSDSEASGDEAPAPVAKPAPAPAQKPSAPKIVNRSSTGKIKINLPAPSRAPANKEEDDLEGRPAKKARVGGSSLILNGMLPAPKKPKLDAPTASSTSGQRALGKGLGAGVNLKTGAEPAFQRVRRDDAEEDNQNTNAGKKDTMNQNDFRAMLNLGPSKAETRNTQSPKQDSAEEPKVAASEAKPAAKPRFLPMSVARNKRKIPSATKPTTGSHTSTSGQSSSATADQKSTPAPEPAPKPKVSLFSISQDVSAPQKPAAGEYKPLLHDPDDADDDAPVPDEAFEQTYQQQDPAPAAYNASAATPQLSDITSDLNLSEAERRQLFGRKGKAAALSSAKIVDFNTDAEYAHNETLRQQGETVQHNALKSISGTGKNSLKSLINVAATQKDALEESFAAGRRNKKEAGNKYGW